MNRTISSVVLLLAFGAPGGAQSLGDLARQEESRRAAVKQPAKIYTNDSLRGEPGSAQPSASAPPPATAPSPAPVNQAPGAQPAPPSPSQAQPQPGGAPGAAPQPDETRTEAYWRQRMTDARDGLARSQTFQEALQSRINALTADFANRADPAQRAVVGADRQKSLAELERVKLEILQYQRTITAIEEEARRAGIPPGWIR